MSDVIISAIIGGIVGGVLGVLAAIISGFFAISVAKKQIEASRRATNDQIEASRRATNDQIEANRRQMIMSQAYTIRSNIATGLAPAFSKERVQTMLNNENYIDEMQKDCEKYSKSATFMGESFLGGNIDDHIIYPYFMDLRNFNRNPSANSQAAEELRHQYKSKLTEILDDFIKEKEKLINEKN